MNEYERGRVLLRVAQQQGAEAELLTREKGRLILKHLDLFHRADEVMMSSTSEAEEDFRGLPSQIQQQLILMLRNSNWGYSLTPAQLESWCNGEEGGS